MFWSGSGPFQNPPRTPKVLIQIGLPSEEVFAPNDMDPYHLILLVSPVPGATFFSPLWWNWFPLGATWVAAGPPKLTK